MTDLLRSSAVALALLAMGCVNASSEPENTAATCSDGKDNDLDGSSDCFDINCIAFPNCTPPEENCAGNFDEDQDGLVDCEDPECVGDPACLPPVEDCADGSDNDGDGLTDCQDPACDNDPICPDEICNNNQDDDGDGDIDCDDVECAAEPNCELDEICNNGVDDDNDTLSDCNDADCAAAPNCTAENCTDGIDNDGDSFIDCADTNCITDPTCSPNALCGDNIKNQVSEACDGADFGGETCTSQGFQSGNLSCNGDCTINTAGCVAPPTCGNGAINAGEDCDGANLNGQSCIGLGFDSGALTCNANCSFNTGACVNNAEICNNNADDDSDGQIDCNDSDCVAAPNCSIPGSGTCAAPFVAQPGVTTANKDTNAGSAIHLSAGIAPDIFSPPCEVGGFGRPEQVYQITVGAAGTLSTSLVSDADLGIYIRISNGGPSSANCGNVNNEVDCVDASFGGGTETTSGTVNTPGTTFYIFVDGCEVNCQDAQGGTNASGPYTLTITLQ